VELGVCVRDRPVDEVARLGRFAEARGYRHLFVPDLRARSTSIVSGRDAFVSLAAAFAVTTELRGGVGVAAVVFHEPDALARTAGSLNEQSGGRFALGIGVSHREAAGAAYPASPLAEMRRWAAEMRRYSRGGDLAFGAGFPVLIGALGPRMVSLGAKEADGVVLNWLTPAHARDTVERVRTEARPGTAPTTVLYVRMSPPEAAHADAVNYDALDNYHRHFVSQGLHDADAIVAGACLPSHDGAAARDRIAEYADAGIDVLCVYPHGFDEADRERALAAVTSAG
jgi:alkanesulfonate monooxygenase SsuD/methylene tetrahydromethanopterin reductase-like flavin-dependent oxidoreductase (luciferase family)